MKGKRVAWGVVMIAFLCCCVPLFAANTLSVQGILRNTEGLPLATGNYSMRAALYDNATSGTELWSEAHTILGGNPVNVTGGCFNITLGQSDPFPSSLFSDYPSLWLEIQAEINGNPETFSRIQLAGAPYAQVAASLQGPINADTLDGLSPSAFAPALHNHDAADIVSGSLSTDRFSAFSDLQAEGKIGTGTGQVAEGDHSHNLQNLLGAVTDSQVPDDITINYAATAGGLSGIGSGTDDVTIYVSGEYGNDNNDGLTTDTAKRTIQAAVDMLLPRLRCNVTIDIADGIYREEVKVFGIAVMPGKTLTFQGDETWTPSSPGDPAVRITGTDDDDFHTKIRGSAFIIERSANIAVKGMLFDYAIGDAVKISDANSAFYNCKCAHGNIGFRVITSSNSSFQNCLAEQNDLRGFLIHQQSTAILTNCTSSYNGEAGIYVDTCSHVDLTDCASNYNGASGLTLNGMASAYFYSSGEFSHNGDNGVHVVHFSMAIFPPPYTGQIQYNDEYGLMVSFYSYTQGHTRNTILNNTLGNLLVANGSNTF